MKLVTEIECMRIYKVNAEGVEAGLLDCGLWSLISGAAGARNLRNWTLRAVELGNGKRGAEAGELDIEG